MSNYCCSVCGKAFPDEDALVGLSFMVTAANLKLKTTHSYEEQLYPYKINTKYNVCYPCWFKSIGIKP